MNTSGVVGAAAATTRRDLPVRSVSPLRYAHRPGARHMGKVGLAFVRCLFPGVLGGSKVQSVRR